MFDLTRPGITRMTKQENAANYEIGPLEPGYGVTIASTLSRVLLSSLPGAAITAVRIEEAKGTSDLIAGVKESILELVLNVKQLRLRCTTDHPVSLHVNVHGMCQVTGTHILVPDTVEILNPECHLATLEQEGAHLTIELIAQKGRGYVAVSSQPQPLLGEDVILIDAIYTPVRRVKYMLEHTRVGKTVNFEKILLSLETDGTMTPDEALCRSSAILLQQFQALAYPQWQASQSDLLIPQDIYEMPLATLALSARSTNALKRNGHMTKVGQILTQDEEELRSIRSVGDKVLIEIKDRLLATGCLPPVEQKVGVQGKD